MKKPPYNPRTYISEQLRRQIQVTNDGVTWCNWPSFMSGRLEEYREWRFEPYEDDPSSGIEVLGSAPDEEPPKTRKNQVMSNPTDSKAMHWRRHEQVADQSTYGPWRVNTVTASACGRLVIHERTTRDPSEADCRECENVRLGVATVEYIRKLGVEAGALQAINEIFGPVIGRGP